MRGYNEAKKDGVQSASERIMDGVDAGQQFNPSSVPAGYADGHKLGKSAKNER